MKIEDLPHLDNLLREGWELKIAGVSDTVRTERPKKFHACIFRHRTFNGHNFIGSTVVEALAGLEQYVESQARTGESQ